MTVDFKLPDLGEGMEEAEVITWLVAAGDRIALDQPFVEVQTDKAVIELPSPYEGVIVSLRADAGDVVKVGSVLAQFEPSSPVSVESPRSTDTGGSAAEPSIAPHDRGAPSAPDAKPTQAKSGVRGRAKASPAVRKLASELGVDLSAVVGSGDGGRVTSDDVHRAATALSAPPHTGSRAVEQATGASRSAAASPSTGIRPGDVIPLRGIRRRMSQVMTESWTIPHITGMDEFDASNLIRTRRDIVDSDPDGPPITFVSFFVKAAAQALTQHPFINATLDLAREEVVLHAAVNIGIAVAAPSGLVVPVVKHADSLTLRGIAAEVARLTGAARDGTLAPADLADGTFTITNYGALGRGRFATPIIRGSEVAILGFGAIVDRPWVVDHELVIRPILPWSFSADHRVIDGQLSGAFQRDVIARLGNPSLMLLDA